MKYIKNDIRGVVELPEALDPTLYDNIGTTIEDYYGGKWVPLDEAQSAFHDENPNASIREIWNCELTPAPVRTLAQAKAEMRARIDAYDVSPAVNGFILGGQQIWLDKATRVGLANSVAIEEAAGRESTTLWFDDTRYTLTIAAAKAMLAAVELYALDCYNVTASHKYSVNLIETIEEVDTYDYKSGYPAMLNLDEL